MDASRRNFLCKGVGMLSAGVVGTALSPGEAQSGDSGRQRWAMVVDLRKCIGCQACTVGCIMENQVPEHGFRTIVSTYEVETKGVTNAYMLPRLCNHCQNPPCVPVCPVGATWSEPDGVVVVDNTRCVGCGYCVQACPYDARFINSKTQTADKCTFCLHRVRAGLLPACVETCVGGARVFGDLAHPDSAVSRLVAENEVKVLKPELGTKPHVFYIGLDPRFKGRVEGEPALWEPAEEEGAH